MNRQLIDKWNRIYSHVSTELVPVQVLSENTFLLPLTGLALDLASGLGANALLLAQQGMTTHAWDISDVAMQKLECHAMTHALPIKTFTQKITSDSFTPASFDVIVVSRFLDRSICDAIMECLKPNGLLFYQTYTQYKISQQGPKNPQFLLAENELLRLFSKLKLIYYRENNGLGLLKQGLRNEAQFIGQKIR